MCSGTSQHQDVTTYTLIEMILKTKEILLWAEISKMGNASANTAEGSGSAGQHLPNCKCPGPSSLPLGVCTTRRDRCPQEACAEVHSSLFIETKTANNPKSIKSRMDKQSNDIHVLP